MAQKRLIREIAEPDGDFSEFTELGDDAAVKAPVTVRLAEIELLIQRDLSKPHPSKSSR